MCITAHTLYTVCGHSPQTTTLCERSGRWPRWLERVFFRDHQIKHMTNYVFGWCPACEEHYGVPIHRTFMILNYWRYKAQNGLTTAVHPREVPIEVLLNRAFNHSVEDKPAREDLAALLAAATSTSGGQYNSLLNNVERMRRMTLEWAVDATTREPEDSPHGSLAEGQVAPSSPQGASIWATDTDEAGFLSIQFTPLPSPVDSMTLEASAEEDLNLARGLRPPPPHHHAPLALAEPSLIDCSIDEEEGALLHGDGFLTRRDSLSLTSVNSDTSEEEGDEAERTVYGSTSLPMVNPWLSSDESSDAEGDTLLSAAPSRLGMAVMAFNVQAAATWSEERDEYGQKIDEEHVEDETFENEPKIETKGECERTLLETPLLPGQTAVDDTSALVVIEREEIKEINANGCGDRSPLIVRSPPPRPKVVIRPPSPINEDQSLSQGHESVFEAVVATSLYTPLPTVDELLSVADERGWETLPGIPSVDNEAGPKCHTPQAGRKQHSQCFPVQNTKRAPYLMDCDFPTLACPRPLVPDAKSVFEIACKSETKRNIIGLSTYRLSPEELAAEQARKTFASLPVNLSRRELLRLLKCREDNDKPRPESCNLCKFKVSMG